MKALPSQHTVPRHPIAVVAERIGLSQDVLRVWERRYSAVSPARGPHGERLYSDADIERLALIQAATLAGRTISKVASLSTKELAALVAEDSAARERRPAVVPSAASEMRDVVGAALALARALDSSGLNDALRRAASTMGVPAFIETVVAPLLRRVGDEWHAGRVTLAQEHLISSLVHDIVAESMRSFAARSGGPRLLVATLAGERHGIGTALVGAAAAAEGWNVLYLGSDLPAAEIADAAAAAGVRVVAVSIVYVAQQSAVIDELRTLRSRLPHHVSLIAGGGGAAALSTELAAIGVRVESSIHGLLAELRSVRSAA
jgi:DNA-binding transcriptional MerR regulator/methylmalonyl-CoA mutase cobalamin-binding subunit